MVSCSFVCVYFSACVLTSYLFSPIYYLQYMYHWWLHISAFILIYFILYHFKVNGVLVFLIDIFLFLLRHFFFYIYIYLNFRRKRCLWSFLQERLGQTSPGWQECLCRRWEVDAVEAQTWWVECLRPGGGSGLDRMLFDSKTSLSC